MGSLAMQPAAWNYLRGAVFGVAAASIWASWSAVTRLAVTTNLDAWDIAALRFGVAGFLLTPVRAPQGPAPYSPRWGRRARALVGAAPSSPPPVTPPLPLSAPPP